MSTDPGSLVPGSLPTTFIPTSSAGNVGYMVMSYPGRPQMVPGIAVPPGMPMPATMAHGMPYMSIGGGSPMVPGVPMPMPPYNMGVKMMPGGVPRRPLGPKQKHQTPHPAQNQASNPPKEPPVVHNVNVPDGPPVTLFVGNIAEKAPDQMIRYMLSACGSVSSWKRVQGFGFCEFSNPDAGLRAIRLLRDFEIGIKKIVVKVDTKTEAVLEEYKNEKRKKKARGSPLQDEVTEEDDYMDEDMRIADRIALERIEKVLADFETELKAAISSANEEARIAAEKQRMNEIVHPPSIKPVDLADVHIEDYRRDLITREIGKFREIMKKQEEEKEVERKRREEKERERRERSQDSTRSVSPASSSPTDRLSTRSSRHHHRSRHHSKSKSRERERERETRDKEKKEERERERERDKERESKSDKDILREKEEEEEAKEKKKAERKAREKEAAYQERLRAWESRERHKLKESIKEKDKKKSKEDEREKEAKRLKQFLEDYDDERDDVKYYKGRELVRRLEEREKEMEADAKDKQREKEELLELKNKIYSENTNDPGMQFAKAIKEREEMYKPKILINVNADYKSSKSRDSRDKHKEYSKDKDRQRESDRDRERDQVHDIDRDDYRRRINSNSTTQQQNIPLPPMSMTPMTLAVQQPQNVHQPRDILPTSTTPINIQSHGINVNSNNVSLPSPVQQYCDNQHSNDLSKQVNLSNSPVNNEDKRKKKLDVKEVFNNDEDDDNNVNSKKRKLVPIDYNEDKKKAKEDKKEELAKIQEEKRKHIKSVIDRIPTDKDQLFSYNLDWAAVDSQLIDRKVRPWINKKIVEYIGEQEPTLVDFICSKVLAGSSPQGILDDVQMVLDEEAEVFVVKMWRLLIYEIEAKKMGLYGLVK